MMPLAERLRPGTLEEFEGQPKLLGKGTPLTEVFDSGRLHSMIFWGPPGTGKTTLARLLAKNTDAEFINMSAVMSGIKEIRNAIEQAKENSSHACETVVFIDEVHRFSKSQQDAFLPHIESGLFYFIGATTENPAFEINNALMSRISVYHLEPLGPEAILCILKRALSTDSYKHITAQENALTYLVELADGDGRKALNLLELVLQADSSMSLNIEMLEKLTMAGKYLRFDKNGDSFYDQLSALHKSVRGSSPDGGLYWFARLVDGGCDLSVIARRLTRIASEDIGNADPRALSIALDGWDAWRRLGSPEGELALAQVLIYLACAPKSNAAYSAFKSAVDDVKNNGSDSVPLHLRNPSSNLGVKMGYGASYRYDHDEPSNIALGQSYFPDSHKRKVYYNPTDNGVEKQIKARLDSIRQAIADASRYDK